MPAPLNLVGSPPFGRLTVVCLASGTKRRSWLCRCSCGSGVGVVATTSALRTGNTKSCGCIQREKASVFGKAASSHAREKNCLYCGRNFLGTNKQQYHSRACKEAAELASREQRFCYQCGEKIDAARSDQSYCSDLCRHRGRHKIERKKKHSSLADQVKRLERAIKDIANEE